MTVGIPVTRSLGHSVTRSLDHSVTRSLCHSVTQSFNHWSLQSLLRLRVTREWPAEIWVMEVTKSDGVTKWPNNRVTEWPSDRVTKWPSDRVIEWPWDRVTDWLSNRVTEWLNDWHCVKNSRTLLETFYPQVSERRKIIKSVQIYEVCVATT